MAVASVKSRMNNLRVGGDYDDDDDAPYVHSSLISLNN